MRDTQYHPLIDTLRLYAGWLLACLSAVYIAGSYQELRHLPFHLDILKEWVDSATILQVTVTTFVFLLLSAVHRAVGKGVWRGVALAVLGFLALVIFKANA